ncbi:MAG: NAD(P)/FAD-dependent oxidoreductase [Rhodoglobus sp.]
MEQRRLARSESVSADVVVLGAGIIGAAIARELTARGLAVTIVESGEAGGGTSGRCDGNVLVQTKLHRPELQLTRRSIEGFRRWVDEFDRNIRFEQSGSMVFFTTEDQVKGGEQRVKLLAELGVSAEYLDEHEVRSREPALDGPLIGGLDCHEDASVYPPFVVYALLEDAVARGARLLSRTTAIRVLAGKDGRVSGVETDAGTISSRWVVNAMGVWSGDVEVDSGITLPIEPRQGLILVTEEAPNLFNRAVTEGAYMSLRSSGSPDPKAGPVFVAEPTFKGNILIGSSRRFVGHSTTADPDLVLAIAERAAHFASALAKVKIIRSFAGLRPWTPDNYPIVGTVDRLPGYVLATGHEGEGIAMAPVTAEMVCQAILGTEPDPGLDEAFRLFDPMRLQPSLATEGVK